MNRQTAERCTILRGLVGSTVHGLNVNDGIEDRDEMGICVEPLEEAMALWAPFEQFIYRTAAEREGRDDARSTAGDLDLTNLQPAEMDPPCAQGQSDDHAPAFHARRAVGVQRRARRRIARSHTVDHLATTCRPRSNA